MSLWTPSKPAIITRRGFVTGAAALAAFAALPGDVEAGLRGHGHAPSAIPASINNPVQGTDLTAVWNLQTGGTGPRSGYTNGAWNGATAGTGGTTTGLPAYLISLGFVWANNNGALYLNVGAASVTIANFDFTGAPSIAINGTGAAIFNDCGLITVAPIFGSCIRAPCDINGNINTSSSTLTVTTNYCLYSKTTFHAGSGTWNASHCKATTLDQNWGGSSAATVNVDWCYVPGLGCNPAAGAHVEAIQYNANSPAQMNWTNSITDVHAEGQVNTPPTTPAYGYTAVATSPVGTGAVLCQNDIFIGLDEMNASAFGANHIPYCFTYGQVTPVTIDNCVLERGVFGYTANGDSGANRPTVSRNRTFANAALTAPDFN